MADGRSARAADLVTQIQDHLNGLCSMFFNFAGALQRDAAPVSVAGEPAPEAPANRQKHDIKEMATQIAQASKQLDELIGRLPSLTQTEQEQLQDIAKLKAGSIDWTQPLIGFMGEHCLVTTSAVWFDSGCFKHR